MTVFYNPKTKKPHPWALIVFVILPILLTISAIYYGQKQFEKKREEERRRSQTDIFEKF